MERRNRPLRPATARFGSALRAPGLCRRQCDGHPNVHRLPRHGRHNHRVGIMVWRETTTDSGDERELPWPGASGGW